MNATEVRDHLRGVAVGLLTPFDEDGAVRHDHLAANAEHLAGEGATTFLANANISEYHSLSTAERSAVTETAVDALPDDACVLAGVGGSTADARDLARAQQRAGADAIMVMPPDHTYVHERGLLAYYREVAGATDRPLVPYVRGFSPSVEYLADLTRVDAVVGVKYALADHVKLGAAVSTGADDVVWVDGAAEPHAVSFWAEGAEGFTAGVSNFRPELGLALYDALAAEEWERARELRNACLPYQRLRAETGTDNAIPGAISVPVVKKGLELAGMHGGSVREPIRGLTAEKERRAERLYADLDDAIERLV
ncbi:MAG: dihydrodipicolinate synthase family protein [Haloarculaceae archaeon]